MLRKKFSLEGFKVVEVQKQLVAGWKYKIIYFDGVSRLFIFTVWAQLDGSYVIIDIKPISDIAPAGQIITLTKAEYEVDQNFLEIDKRMRAEDNLGGFLIDQVTRQQDNGDVYTIVYKGPEIIVTVRVKLGKAVPVHYREIRKNY